MPRRTDIVKMGETKEEGGMKASEWYPEAFLRLKGAAVEAITDIGDAFNGYDPAVALTDIRVIVKKLGGVVISLEREEGAVEFDE